MRLYVIREQGDVFVDAAAADDHGQLLFVSLYGRDTAIQQFMSRLHLRGKEGGVDRLRFADPETYEVELEVLVGDPNRLDKVTGRLPKENLFGNLVHAWIFDSSVVEVDKASRSGWYMHSTTTGPASNESARHIWSLVTSLSSVPLMEHWQEPVVEMLGTEGIRSSRAVGHVAATRVALPDDFEAQVSGLVIDGTLAPDVASTENLQANLQLFG